VAYLTHELKIHPTYFQEVINGNKTFEIRKNDRDYSVGDVLFLNEYDPDKKIYTGRRTRVKITYITNYAQAEDYIVIGIKLEHQLIKLFKASYFADEYQQEAIVAAANVKRVEQIVSKDCQHFELINIEECIITSENIIHAEVIGMV
jgi:hypothetical protein